MRYVLVLFVFAASSLLSPCPASSELIQRTAELVPRWEASVLYCRDALDFSTQSIVECYTATADFTFQENYREPNTGYFVFIRNGATILEVDAPFENVVLAPLTGYQDFEFDGLLATGNTYILKTGDDLYVKLVIRYIDAPGCCVVGVEYVVQTDGTRVLSPGLSTAPATWGRIKALYR